jgi:hypothetical protein
LITVEYEIGLCQLTFKHWRSGSEDLYVCPAAVLLEFRNLKLPDFAQVSGQPLTAAWL